MSTDFAILALTSLSFSTFVLKSLEAKSARFGHCPNVIRFNTHQVNGLLKFYLSAEVEREQGLECSFKESFKKLKISQ